MLWYAVKQDGTYTRMPDMYRAGQVLIGW